VFKYLLCVVTKCAHSWVRIRNSRVTVIV